MDGKLVRIAQEYLEWFEDQKRDDIGLLAESDFKTAMVMRDYLRLRLIDHLRNG